MSHSTFYLNSYSELRANVENCNNLIKINLNELKSFKKNTDAIEEDLIEIKKYISIDEIKELIKKINIDIANKETELNNYSNTANAVLKKIYYSYSEAQTASINLVNQTPSNENIKKNINKLDTIMISATKKSSEIKKERHLNLINSVESKLMGVAKELIQNWNESGYNELNSLIKDVKKSDYEDALKIVPKFDLLFDKYLKESLDCDKKYYIKVDTSEGILKTLEEMGYVNIERKLETDKFGKVIINTESPNGDLKASFKVDDNGKIEVETNVSQESCTKFVTTVNKKIKDNFGIDVNLENFDNNQSQKKATATKKENKYETL